MVAIYTRQSVDRADSISVELQAETRRAKLTANELETCKTYTDKGFFEQKHKPTGPSPPDEGRSGRPGGKDSCLQDRPYQPQRSRLHRTVPAAVREGR